jgi:foldase protein PrsA
MIAEVLIRQRAQELGVEATEADIDRAYERAVAMAGSPGDFERQLQRRAITPEQFRETLVPQVLLDEVIAKTVKVSREEIKAYYDAHIDEFRLSDRVRARLIMLDTRESADELRKVLDMEGADFARWAQILSIDPGTKDEGGDTGYFPREGYYAEEIASRAFAMRVGEISDVFEAPDGYCILKLIGRKPPETRPLSEVRDMVRSRVAFDKRQEMRTTWLTEQRQKADINILDPHLE